MKLVKCLLLARESVFWHAGITNDIKQLVKDCDTCNKYQAEQPKLPLMHSRFTYKAMGEVRYRHI